MRYIPFFLIAILPFEALAQGTCNRAVEGDMITLVCTSASANDVHLSANVFAAWIGDTLKTLYNKGRYSIVVSPDVDMYRFKVQGQQMTRLRWSLRLLSVRTPAEADYYFSGRGTLWTANTDKVEDVCAHARSEAVKREKEAFAGKGWRSYRSYTTTTFSGSNTEKDWGCLVHHFRTKPK